MLRKGASENVAQPQRRITYLCIGGLIGGDRPERKRTPYSISPYGLLMIAHVCACPRPGISH